MKIKSICSSNSKSSFGMSLNMPQKNLIARKIGNYAASEAENARKPLGELAKDVNIHVFPRSSLTKDVTCNNFDIYVTAIPKTPKEKFLAKLFGTEKKPQKVKHTNRRVYVDKATSKETLADVIVKTADKLKKDFLKYSK